MLKSLNAKFAPTSCTLQKDVLQLQLKAHVSYTESIQLQIFSEEHQKQFHSYLESCILILVTKFFLGFGLFFKDNYCIYFKASLKYHNTDTPVILLKYVKVSFFSIPINTESRQKN